MSVSYTPLVETAIFFCQEKPCADSFCCGCGSHVSRIIPSTSLNHASIMDNLLIECGCFDKQKALLVVLQPYTLQQRYNYSQYNLQQQKCVFASMAYLIIVGMTQAALVKVWFWLHNSEHSLLLVAQLGSNLSCKPYPSAHLTSINMPAELYGIDLTQCNSASGLRRHKAQFNMYKSIMTLFTLVYLSPTIFFCLLLNSLPTASIGHYFLVIRFFSLLPQILPLQPSPSYINLCPWKLSCFFLPCRVTASLHTFFTTAASLPISSLLCCLLALSAALWVHLKALPTIFSLGWGGFLPPHLLFYLHSVSYN